MDKAQFFYKTTVEYTVLKIHINILEWFTY